MGVIAGAETVEPPRPPFSAHSRPSRLTTIAANRSNMPRCSGRCNACHAKARLSVISSSGSNHEYRKRYSMNMIPTAAMNNSHVEYPALLTEKDLPIGRLAVVAKGRKGEVESTGQRVESSFSAKRKSRLWQLLSHAQNHQSQRSVSLRYGRDRDVVSIPRSELDDQQDELPQYRQVQQEDLDFSGEDNRKSRASTFAMINPSVVVGSATQTMVSAVEMTRAMADDSWKAIFRPARCARIAPIAQHTPPTISCLHSRWQD